MKKKKKVENDVQHHQFVIDDVNLTTLPLDHWCILWVELFISLSNL